MIFSDSRSGLLTHRWALFAELGKLLFHRYPQGRTSVFPSSRIMSSSDVPLIEFEQACCRTSLKTVAAFCKKASSA